MKIAIFGLARSGLAALKFLVNNTEHEVFAINQGNARSWANFEEVSKYISLDHCISQSLADDFLASIDRIILSPGISRQNKTLEKAIKANVEIISEIELAFEYSKTPVIAITGTNGKTTTSTMVAQVLERSGKKVFLGGNIGTSYCEIFNDSNYDYAVIEVSSFQLETIKTFKPQIAMLLNITQNHAERYDSIQDYADAKYKLFKNMGSSEKVLLGKGLSSSTIKSQVTYIEDLSSFDFSKSRLVGQHNKKNFFCAWKVLEFLEINNRQEIMQNFIHEFTGVSYRLEFVGESAKLKFYNDAKSTNNDATKSAVMAFQGLGYNLYLIVGGKLRSENIDLIDALNGLLIKEVFAIGEASQKIYETFQSQFKTSKFKDLEAVFEHIKNLDPKGVVLFSPAFPSFDQYENYEKRGEHFNTLVNSFLEL